MKKEFLQMLVNMELDPARQRLVYGFFERYLTMTREEEAQLNKEIKTLPEADKIMEIPISYEEKGKEKGRAEEKKQVALKLMKRGTSFELIAEITGLSEKELALLEGDKY